MLRSAQRARAVVIMGMGMVTDLETREDTGSAVSSIIANNRQITVK